MSDAAAWSAWSAFSPRLRLEPAVFVELLDGGQAFRWTTKGDGIWLGLWDRHVARVRLNPSNHLEWSVPGTATAADEVALAGYFDVASDAAVLADRLPWRSDAHLARCMESLPGLRILRQPFGETLLCFLCSSAKRIAQIRQMASLMAERMGKPAGARFRRLPSWPELAAATEDELRGCLLGFRARYIHQTARFLAAHPGWLEETGALPYPAAKERLCSLPGVGEKIADCVLLYGGGRLEAFPVDVWILKAMERRYGLSGWSPRQVAHFGRMHFGPLAGLAQQYLFAWERKAG